MFHVAYQQPGCEQEQGTLSIVSHGNQSDLRSVAMGIL